VNAHISEYSHGNLMNHVPVRRRKLLLHRGEIDKLRVETRERGLTIVPTKLYLKGGLIKVEIAVGKGKKFHDKREAIKAREMQAEAKAALGRRGRQ
jgi:SsrA-binding protein